MLPGEAEVTEIAREILGYLKQTHRRAGARLTISKLRDRFGADPAITAALSELVRLGYVHHPDVRTIELTTRGFEATQRLDAI
jgi:Mn-dependent DtxR family transcriptional regulator